MPIPTHKHQLSTAEKVLVIKVHEYFVREKSLGRAGSQRKTRRRVADCLGFSTNAISKIVTDWRTYEDPT